MPESSMYFGSHAAVRLSRWRVLVSDLRRHPGRRGRVPLLLRGWRLDKKKEKTTTQKRETIHTQVRPRVKIRPRVRSKRPRVRKAVGRLGLPGDANELIWTKEKPDRPDSRDRKVSLPFVAQLNSARLKNTAELHYTKLNQSYRKDDEKISSREEEA